MKRILAHPALRSWSAFPQLAFHQAGWWACVIWMGWRGPSIMAVFVVTHLVIMRHQLRHELSLVIVSLFLGILLDNALAMVGVVHYVGEVLVGQSPLWLVAIWAGFGATLRHSQAVLIQSLPIALATGFVGGPLAYLGGEKLERMVVHGWHGWCGIALLWGIAITTLWWTNNRLSTKSAEATLDPTAR